MYPKLITYQQEIIPVEKKLTLLLRHRKKYRNEIVAMLYWLKENKKGKTKLLNELHKNPRGKKVFCFNLCLKWTFIKELS